MTDILIIGGGPAGLTAAMYAGRAGKSCAVLERAAPGGQALYAPLVENYPGLPGVSGAALADTLLRQAEEFGAALFYENAVGARWRDGVFQVETDEGIREGRALILAAGVEHRALGLPGETALTGRGISFCAVCDGAFYAGKDVAVVGGGDTALQEALFLSGVCRKVTVLVRRDRFRGEAVRAAALSRRENVDIRFRHVVEGWLSDENGLTGARVRNLTWDTVADVPLDGAFLAVGQEPGGGAFAGLVDMDPAGYVLTGEDLSTNRPGVFAAGDCRRKTARQLATAVGDGAAAALAACRWLERETS